MVGDPVALSALFRLAPSGKASFFSSESKGGESGQPGDPFLTIQRERESIAADRCKCPGMFGISYCVEGSVGTLGQRVCG
jgi:hypothetical protein